MNKNLSHRQWYLNELDEAGIKVTFHPDFAEDRVRIKVQKDNSYAVASMDIEHYYDDAAYNRVLRKLVNCVENEWNKKPRGLTASLCFIERRN